MRVLKSNLLHAALAVAAVAALAGCTADIAAAGGTSTAAAPPATASSDLTDNDGYIPVGNSLHLDSDKPAITRLNPALRDALVAANTAAQDERGVTITIVDGWRSERYQAYLFQQAVYKYGSEEEASKWVKRPGQSTHGTGDAVDIETADAMDFLNRFGDEWGLCQAFANENWHFELLTTPGGTCPMPSADGRG